MKIAIVAHYDPEGAWCENFLALLGVVDEIADRVVVVTTSPKVNDFPNNFRNVTLLRRPNIGYDFYSYRSGIGFAMSNWKLDGIFIINSSIILLNKDLFRGAMIEISSSAHRAPARGLTESRQFGWHMQSYFLYFDTSLLPKGWLLSFFNRVEPTNTKLETILRYEIGLGRSILTSDISRKVMFRPNRWKFFLNVAKKTSSILKNQKFSFSGVAQVCHGWWGVLRGVNWAHFGAAEIAQRFGIVKAEFLRSNPFDLPQDPVWRACEPSLRNSVEIAVDRSRQHYSAQSSGLTEVQKNTDSIGIIREIFESPIYRIKNAKTAAVIHVFYVELIDEIFDILQNIAEPFNVYITTPFEADVPTIINAAHLRKIPITVALVNNKGRDVGPFMALYLGKYLDNYDSVLKLHSKKSLYSCRGEQWRRQLYAALCGTSLVALRSISLIRDQGCGIVGPHRFFLTNQKYLGSNQEKLSMIFREFSVKYDESKIDISFFAGTMFWFSPRALSGIHAANRNVLEFESENGKQDGTLAHAWERAFCGIARAAGYTISTIEMGGKELQDIDGIYNTVDAVD